MLAKKTIKKVININRNAQQHEKNCLLSFSFELHSFFFSNSMQIKNQYFPI